MLPIMAGSGGAEISTRAFLGAFRPGKDTGRTQQKRCQIYAAFLEELGTQADRPLSTLRAETCRAFFEKRAQSMSPTTLRAYRAYLNSAFDAAVEHGLLRVSPMQQVPQPPRRPQAAGEDTAFSPEEVQRMLTEFPPAYRALVGLRVYCGGLGITDCQKLLRSQLNRAAGMLMIPNRRPRSGFTAYPLPPEFLQLLDDIAKPGDEFILQELHGMHTCHISRRFSNLCRQHGLIDPAATRQMPGGTKRNNRSFLSLRKQELGI